MNKFRALWLLFAMIFSGGLVSTGTLLGSCSSIIAQPQEGITSGETGTHRDGADSEATTDSEAGDRNAGQSTVLVQETEQPTALVVDETHIYWLTNGVTARLRKAPKSGGTAETLVSALSFPSQLSLDGDLLYWKVQGNLWRVSRQGGKPERITDNAAVQTYVVEPDKIYWTDRDAVMVMPKGGGSPTTVFKGEFTTGIAIDQTHIYWVNRLNGEIYKGTKDGQQPTSLTSFVGDQTMDLWHDTTYLYWITPNDRKFSRIAKAGGKREILATEIVMQTVVWFQGALYATQPFAGGSIFRMKPGSPPETLVSGLGTPWGLAVDQTHLYWSEHNQNQILRTLRP